MSDKISGLDFDPLDGYHFMLGEPLRPKWRNASYRKWFAVWPVKTDEGWRWLRWVYRRRRWANRLSVGFGGMYVKTTVDHLCQRPEL